MNKAMLPRMLWQRVRVWPPARSVCTDGLVLPTRDDEWIPVRLDPVKELVWLQNVCTAHVASLDYVDIHHYDSDDARSLGGLKHGRLRLLVQLTMSGCNLYKKPLPTFRRCRRSK